MKNFKEVIVNSFYFAFNLGMLYIFRHYFGMEATIIFALASILANQDIRKV
jgi:hypothetical protein